ncbi:MAG: hypothetical protein JSS64_13570 [Bacteroidetes bacterium]|nr:hypothetical protein [Bacteroidota bacterium]
MPSKRSAKNPKIKSKWQYRHEFDCLIPKEGNKIPNLTGLPILKKETNNRFVQAGGKYSGNTTIR